MSLRLFIREVLKEAYSQGLVNRLREKFKKENSEIDDETIESYIKIFDQNKDGPKIKGSVKGNDIMRYSWSELEAIVNANFSTESRNEEEIQTDMKPVYESEDKTLQIFLGDRKEKCVIIRQNAERKMGSRYEWCISRSDSSNMFYTYRHRLEEPVFYYVFDTDRSRSDMYHAVVIYPNSKNEYFLATAKNTGDEKMTWDQISSLMPKLKNIQNIFKNIPLTPKERKTADIISVEKTDKEFSKLSYDLKDQYISYGHDLSESKIRDIWNLDRDLVNKYCTSHKYVFLPIDIWKQLPESTKKVIKENFYSDEVDEADFADDEEYQARLNDEERVKGGADAFSMWYLEQRNFYDLNLSGTEISVLPEGLRITNLLDISYTGISELPRDLKTNSLDAQGTFIKTLPKNFKILGKLTVSTIMKSLPEGLDVGSLNMQYNNGITELPPGIKISNVLYANGSKLKFLPDNLKVRRLEISGTPITSLPNGLMVDYLIVNSEIKSLPPDIFIKYPYYISNSSLPSRMLRGNEREEVNLLIKQYQEIEKERKNLTTESLLKKFAKEMF